MDRFASGKFDFVGTGNIKVMTQLVTHVAELGHKRIGMVSGLPDVRTTEERLEGYAAGLESCGLPHDPEIIKCGNSNADAAEVAVYRLLAARNRPTALAVGNNYMTVGALGALRRRKIKIPDDMALVSFGDFEWSDPGESSPYGHSATN